MLRRHLGIKLHRIQRWMQSHYRSRFWGNISEGCWVREVMVVTKGVKRGAMKVICGTSSYDYGTLRYVEEMFL